MKDIKQPSNTRPTPKQHFLPTHNPTTQQLTMKISPAIAILSLALISQAVAGTLSIATPTRSSVQNDAYQKSQTTGLSPTIYTPVVSPTAISTPCPDDYNGGVTVQPTQLPDTTTVVPSPTAPAVDPTPCNEDKPGSAADNSTVAHAGSKPTSAGPTNATSTLAAQNFTAESSAMDFLTNAKFVFAASLMVGALYV